jgi:pyruvate decarboxylase
MPKSTPYAEPPSKPNDDIITQAWFWPTFSRFLRTDDLIIVETGTPANGFATTQLPGPVTVWTQEVFGSIGYATGAIVGAAVAHKERGGKRCILITGEGSLQMTVQALSELLRSAVNAHL